MGNVGKVFDWNPRLLRSPQYFEAVARLGSVDAAAENLGVSASAVSHQLKSLANDLGENLFVRVGRRLALTERGLRLQEQVAPALTDLALALKDSVGVRKDRLRVAVCASFGPFWLAQHLPEFLTQNPRVDLETRLFTRDPEQSESVADVIVTANAVAEGFESVALFEETLVAVGKPRGTSKGAPLPRRLITTDLPPARVGQDWYDFWSLTGQDPEDTPKFLRCSNFVLALAYAKADIGDAIVPDFVAAESVASGDLVLLDPARIPSGRTYRLCYKILRSADPALRLLVKWMRTVSTKVG